MRTHRISCSPAASAELGSSVALVVAAPFPRVPAVVGKPESTGIRNLKNAGFKVKKTTQTRTTGKDGVVLSQSRPGGTRAKPNSVVRIVISNVQRRADAGGTSNCTPGYTPCHPPHSTMTVVMAQAMDLNTPDPSASRVPTPTTSTETVTEKHASGRDQAANQVS